LDDGYGLVDGGYRLSTRQAQAILDLRLNRLTGLEQQRLINEYDEILVRIEDLLDILSNPERLRAVIRGELLEVKEQYGDERRTEIIATHRGFDPEDLITQEDVVVTVSYSGYVKWQPLSVYSAQKRGGKGKSATTMKSEDFIDQLIVANTHDTVLCFSSHGKVYWIRVFELPQAGRTARGSPIVNVFPLEEGERITAILPMTDFKQKGFVVMATSRGLVKKTELASYSRPRSTGLIAIELLPEDTLVGVAITDGSQDILLASNNGKAVRFNEGQVRAMGRVARGVIGMRLAPEDRIISLMIGNEGLVLTATENGYGKCTKIAEYPIKGRGTKGVISVQTSARNGDVVGSLLVQPTDEIMLITNGGGGY
jgi:DNA gyrase subunit A